MENEKCNCTARLREVDSAKVMKGRSPYIDESTLHWMEWDDDQQKYVDTGRVAALTDYIEKSEGEIAGYKQAADSAAQSAATERSAAEAAKTAAETAAEDAEAAQTAAKSVASGAQKYAASAAASAGEAMIAANAAKGYEETVENSATEAAASAGNAKAYMSNALNAANNAGSSQAAANISETNAAASATSAALSAESAAKSESNAVGSATAAVNAANTATAAAKRISDSAAQIEQNKEDIAENKTAIAGKQDTLIAGNGISIDGNIISATETGTVKSVNNKEPDSSGNVDLSASDVGVPAWATAETKPAYTASEINDGEETVAEEVAALKTEIVEEAARAEAAEALKANQTALDSTERRLRYLFELNEGISYNFETDSTEAYEKAVPTGAKVMTVQSVGGKSVIWNQWAQNAPFSSRDGLTTSTSANYCIINGTATASSYATGWWKLTKKDMGNDITGHIVFIGTKIISGSYEGTALFGTIGSSATVGSNLVKAVTSSDYNSTGNLSAFRYVSGFAATNLTLFVYLHDLTQMFGVTSTSEVTDEMKAWCESYAALHPEYNAGEIVSADVDAVNITDTAGTTTALTVPKEIRALDGYGWSVNSKCNTVDYESKKYAQRISEYKIGTKAEEWNYNTYDSGSVTLVVSGIADLVPTTSRYYGKCDKWYPVQSLYSNKKAYFYFKNACASYSTLDDFKSYISGATIMYVLGTPIETDISDYLTDAAICEPVEVEAGGTVTIHNDNLLATPNTEEYLIALAEVES